MEWVSGMGSAGVLRVGGCSDTKLDTDARGMDCGTRFGDAILELGTGCSDVLLL